MNNYTGILVFVVSGVDCIKLYSTCRLSWLSTAVRLLVNSAVLKIYTNLFKSGMKTSRLESDSLSSKGDGDSLLRLNKIGNTAQFNL